MHALRVIQQVTTCTNYRQQADFYDFPFLIFPALGQARITGRQATGGSVVRTGAAPVPNTSVPNPDAAPVVVKS
jgi:hypothetical protein